MERAVERVALGGGCHWCTEAVFDSLDGVVKVDQGWVAAEEADAQSLSEAVIVHYDENLITLDRLIEIHLLTHNATSYHSMRRKYRSAIYVFSQKQKERAFKILQEKFSLFEEKIITKVYIFADLNVMKRSTSHTIRKTKPSPFVKSI